jgi:hypothetical protein
MAVRATRMILLLILVLLWLLWSFIIAVGYVGTEWIMNAIKPFTEAPKWPFCHFFFLQRSSIISLTPHKSHANYAVLSLVDELDQTKLGIHSLDVLTRRKKVL